MILLNGVKVNLTKFPNGETHIDSKELEKLLDSYNTIGLKYEDDSDLIKLMFIKRHLDLCNLPNPSLKIYYMPYSRMDRTENKKVFTLKYISEFINSLNFKKVTIYQPHSDVSTALIDRSHSIDMSVELLNEVLDKVKFNKEKDYIYYPDASAEKHFGKSNTYKSLVGLKQRDFESGKIKRLDVVGELPKQNRFKVVMIDDLCSRGGTFLLGAEKLRELGASEIYLVVTHCEESIYEGDMFKTDLIDKVFTTNSIVTEVMNERIEVKDIIGGQYRLFLR